MSFQFKNKEVADKYETDFENDPDVHVPGGTGQGWRGKLSQLPFEFAEKLQKMDSNLIRAKQSIVSETPPGVDLTRRGEI